MLQRKIHMDIRSYKTKVFAGFTLRQTIVIALCIILFASVFFGFHLPVSTTIYVCLVPFLFLGAFGWAEPEGMKFETYLRTIFITMILSPHVRVYKSVNIYDTEEHDIPTDKKEIIPDKKTLKEHPEYEAFE